MITPSSDHPTGNCTVPVGSTAPRCICDHGFDGVACDTCQPHFEGSSCDRCETNYIGYNTDCSVRCVHGDASSPGEWTCYLQGFCESLVLLFLGSLPTTPLYLSLPSLPNSFLCLSPPLPPSPPPSPCPSQLHNYFLCLFTPLPPPSLPTSYNIMRV